MTGIEPTAHLVAEFSEPDATALPWSEVVSVLETSEMFWLSTVRRDGRPHVAPLPAMWLDGKLHFCTGAHEQKAKNIEANPRCVLTTGTNSYRSGVDVVIEGTVARVGDNGMLGRLVQIWRDKIDWVSESVTASSSTAGRREWRWSSRSRRRRSWRSPRLRTARRATSCDPGSSSAGVTDGVPPVWRTWAQAATFMSRAGPGTLRLHGSSSKVRGAPWLRYRAGTGPSAGIQARCAAATTRRRCRLNG